MPRRPFDPFSLVFRLVMWRKIQAERERREIRAATWRWIRHQQRVERLHD